MNKFERIVCVAAPSILGVILVIVGNKVIGQETAVNSPTGGMMGIMFICTGLLCAALSCIAYPLVALVKLSGRQEK